MKWYFLVLVLYSSFWGFLGWGIQGEITGLIITLALYLTSMLITIFNFKNPVLKEATIILYAPSMITYAIIKDCGSMSNWKIIFIIIAILLQAGLLIPYYYYKAKKKKETKF